MRACLGYLPWMLLVGFMIAFFGSLTWAAASFPAGYDWRYSVMSSLATPRENPTAYRIAAAGMAASGIFLSLLGLCIRSSLQTFSPSKWTNVACCCFVLGGMLIMISALITPGHHAFLGLRKAHAKFAQAGTFSFDVGMVLTLPALLSLPASRQGVRMVSVILVLVPLTSYLLSRILLPSLADPDSLNRTTHPPLLGSLAFWEWTGSATVFLYTGIIVLALKPKFALHPGPNKIGF